MTIDTVSGLETKVAAAADSEPRQAFDEFMSAFEAFKDANDERLRDMERRMSADTVTAEKVDRSIARSTT